MTVTVTVTVNVTVTVAVRKQILWIGIQKEHFVVLVVGCFFGGEVFLNNKR